MPSNGPPARSIRFGIFEVDLQSGELRKAGVKLKLGGQPFQVLAILLERPGDIFTREELQKRLWPDTFVDVDHNLNTAINKIREVLSDSAENPRFVETLPRRGYRFIAPLDNAETGLKPATRVDTAATRRWRILGATLLFGVLALLVGTGFFVYRGRHAPASPRQRTLTRATFGDGLQIGATWSPDGRYIAYSSDRGGKFDIWVQQVSGGDPVQVTKGPGQHRQPDWSPDGKYIAYRSEEGEGGLYIVPALGGAGLERKISSFGYFPRWSPDSSEILFQTHFGPLGSGNKFYIAHLDGSVPKQGFGRIRRTPQAVASCSCLASRREKSICLGLEEEEAQMPSLQMLGSERLDGANFRGARNQRWRSLLPSKTNSPKSPMQTELRKTWATFPLPGHLRARPSISSVATKK